VPSTPDSIAAKVGLGISGSAPWGTKPGTSAPGIYLVSLSADPNRADVLQDIPLSAAAIQEWLDTAPMMTVDDVRARPSTLATRLARYWLPDETILYIGKAVSLSDRVGGFYSSRIGHARPHRGGMWLKTLSNLDHLTVHYAVVDRDPGPVESRALGAFMARVSAGSRRRYPEQERDLPLPFANLEWHSEGKRCRRQHGIARPTAD